MSDLVDVLLGDAGTPITIIGSRRDALNHPEWTLGRVKLDYPRNLAVESIRRIVFERADYQCEHCGGFVSWKTGQLDERVPRGQGGEVSVDNGACLCPKCHIVGPESKHGKRLPKFSKGKR